jgi:hypothetical protein
VRHGRDLLAAVNLLIEGISAAEKDRVDDARAALHRLEAIPDARLPLGSKRAIVAHLGYRVALAERRFDDALVAIDAVEHLCRRHARRASIEDASGDAASAAADRRWIVDHAAYCRASQYQGAFVLEALVRLAQSAHADGRVDDARALVARAQDLFPSADVDLLIVGARDELARTLALVAPVR